MDLDSNPFAVLSLIVAPAILTNASSILVMSTSNRLARSVDRARELSKQLESAEDFASAETQRRMKELAATEQRSLMLVRALRHFYVALSGFASAALLSLLGAVLVPFEAIAVLSILEILAVAAGAVAVGTLVKGSTTLVRETRIAVKVLCERADSARTRIETLAAYQRSSEREIA
jgi:archaellum biogenesis protein FlaJ (TadC family)